jgi:hypothetical protein
MSHQQYSLPLEPESSGQITPFESIRRTNPASNEFWSSRDFAKVLGYADYRNFQSVIESARTACFNSGQRVEDHFVAVTEIVEIGSSAQRPLKTVLLARFDLEEVITKVFPSAKDLIQKMVMEERFKDVTFETLNRPDFLECVQQVFPRINWDRAYIEFKEPGETAKA